MYRTLCKSIRSSSISPYICGQARRQMSKLRLMLTKFQRMRKRRQVYKASLEWKILLTWYLIIMSLIFSHWGWRNWRRFWDQWVLLPCPMLIFQLRQLYFQLSFSLTDDVFNVLYQNRRPRRWKKLPGTGSFWMILRLSGWEIQRRYLMKIMQIFSTL